MDHPWTTGIELSVLNREKVAEGVGFAHGGANVRERSPVFKTSDLLLLTTHHNS